MDDHYFTSTRPQWYGQPSLPSSSSSLFSSSSSSSSHGSSSLLPPPPLPPLSFPPLHYSGPPSTSSHHAGLSSPTSRSASLSASGSVSSGSISGDRASGSLIGGSTLDTSDWRSTNNVYIKGLPEICNNEDLQAWAEQVAKPLSVKTIRDAKNPGICTGLGFVRFALPAHATLFITIVNATSKFEACLAKETYVGKMDKASDPRSANLYLSHIPLSYNEDDVLALFPSPRYIVRSLRLLHEGDQPGKRAPLGTAFKGAGFVRLDNRDMAAQAISELNGKRLPGHSLKPGRTASSSPTGEMQNYWETLQVRFADTDLQKNIKRNESERERIEALEAAGQLPPKSRKGQAYRKLSIGTEQRIRETSKLRRPSAISNNSSILGGRSTSSAGFEVTSPLLPDPLYPRLPTSGPRLRAPLSPPLSPLSTSDSIFSTELGAPISAYSPTGMHQAPSLSRGPSGTFDRPLRSTYAPNESYTPLLPALPPAPHLSRSSSSLGLRLHGPLNTSMLSTASDTSALSTDFNQFTITSPSPQMHHRSPSPHIHHRSPSPSRLMSGTFHPPGRSIYTPSGSLGSTFNPIIPRGDQSLESSLSLAPASALARRSSAVEARLAGRTSRGSDFGPIT